MAKQAKGSGCQPPVTKSLSVGRPRTAQGRCSDAWPRRPFGTCVLYLKLTARCQSVIPRRKEDRVTGMKNERAVAIREACSGMELCHCWTVSVKNEG